jgi:hypothetical protein
MNRNIGLYKSGFKTVGAAIAGFSLLLFLAIKILNFDFQIYGYLNFSNLLLIFYGMGLTVFIFSKNKGDELNIKSDIISRVILMALYGTFIAFSLVQYIHKNFTLDIIDVVLFFLTIQTLISVIFQYTTLTYKTFYIATSVIAILGFFVLFLSD